MYGTLQREEILAPIATELFLMTVQRRIRLCMESTWLAVSTWGLDSLYVVLVPPACSNGALFS